jgi:hypothetical protein
MNHDTRSAIVRAAKAGSVSLGLIALVVSARLAAARGDQLAPASSQNCATTAPCFSASNTGPGNAIQGAASNNSAVVGQTRASSATLDGGKIHSGIRGADLSPVPSGQTINYSGGVLGTSKTGFGVWGFSKVQSGVIGVTYNPSGKDKYVAAGVQGLDNSTDGGQANAGVLGISARSNGVQGITNNPSVKSQFGRAAIFGIDASTDGGRRNWGSAGFSRTGTGILGISFATPQTSGASFASALLALCENGGPSIEAADGPLPSANLFLLADCVGNITIAGTLTTGSAPLIRTRTADRGDVVAYAPREASPTIEDFGRAQLHAGSVLVPLDRDFASAVDTDATYLVLITPEGDSRGLYVAKKTADAFEVRESQGGRSSIPFSYRIVARPLGSREGRLPLFRSVVSRRTAFAHAAAP